MILGLLLVAMFTGAGGSAILYAMDAPLWMIILGYPVVGTSVLLSGVWLLGSVRQHQPQQLAPIQYPVPRSTTPTVANSTLRSVANESRRS
jgi:hypothetical protein